MSVARVTIWAGILALLALPMPALADPAPAVRQGDRASPYMRVYGVSQPPYGYVKFCEREPDECRQGPPEEQRFSAKPDRLSELDAVNRAVNHEIEPATDLDAWRMAEGL
jgi:predicted transglutaminase-like cysteine proteinase